MKLYLLLFLLFTTRLFSQISLPYHQEFEDDSFYLSDDFKMAALASQAHPYGKDIIVTQDIVTQEANGYSWELSNNNQNYGKALKLTVHKEDHPQNATCSRSRAEVYLNLNNEINHTYFYSWEMFFPENNEFIDENPPKNFECSEEEDSNRDQNPYHKIIQIANTTFENGQEINVENRLILGMDYEHDQTQTSLDHRNLYILLHDPTMSGNPVHKRIRIFNAIQKGEWNEFIFKINWSENSNTGYIEIWINRKPVIVDEIGSYSYHKSSLGNINDSPYNFKFPNMTFTNDNNPAPVHNIMKMGHYRRHHTLNHSVYIDNYKITKEFPTKKNRTKLLSEYCNSDLTVDDFKIECYPVANANNYIFKFENNGETYFVNNGSNTTLNLNNITLNNPNGSNEVIQPNTTYLVSVRARRIINNIEEFGYSNGEVCNITTPKYTKLINEHCDTTIPADNLIIQCYPITGANNYLFQVEKDGNYYYKNNGNNTVLDLNNLTLSNPNGPDIELEINKTYNVKVRVRKIVNGIEIFGFNYGESCEITIPKYTKLKEEYCNKLITIGQTIKCYPIPRATSYKFRFTNENNVFRWIDSDTNSITIPYNSYFINGSSYIVDVREINHDYSESCNISISSSSYLTKSSTNTTVTENISINSKKINIYPNPTNNYLYLSNSEDISMLKVLDITGKVILAKKDINKNEKINLEAFSNGTYLLVIEKNNSQKSIHRIVKR